MDISVGVLCLQSHLVWHFQLVRAYPSVSPVSLFSCHLSTDLLSGKEGPFVHIASCIGNIVSRFHRKYENNEGLSSFRRHGPCQHDNFDQRNGVKSSVLLALPGSLLPLGHLLEEPCLAWRRFLTTSLQRQAFISISEHCWLTRRYVGDVAKVRLPVPGKSIITSSLSAFFAQ